jgi:hypothetical protein
MACRTIALADASYRCFYAFDPGGARQTWWRQCDERNVSDCAAMARSMIWPPGY